jgi:hypothetical protein
MYILFCTLLNYLLPHAYRGVFMVCFHVLEWSNFPLFSLLNCIIDPLQIKSYRGVFMVCFHAYRWWKPNQQIRATLILDFMIMYVWTIAHPKVRILNESRIFGYSLDQLIHYRSNRHLHTGTRVPSVHLERSTLSHDALISCRFSSFALHKKALPFIYSALAWKEGYIYDWGGGNTVAVAWERPILLTRQGWPMKVPLHRGDKVPYIHL